MGYSVVFLCFFFDIFAFTQYVVLALSPPEDVQFKPKIKNCVFQVTGPSLNF